MQKQLKRVLKHKKRLLYAANMLVVIAIGVVLYMISGAATPTKAFEAEGGTPNNKAHVMSASGASGGSAIHFGMSMDNDLGTFLRNATLGSRYRQYENVSETDVTQNLANNARGNFEPGTGGGYQPHGSQGQFRFFCQYSHLNYDDPIVYPPINGVPQAGKAHLHMFWGNTKMDAATTNANIMTRGGGSCAGFEANRTGYWMPAVLDGSNKVVIPKTILMYYKTAQNAAAQTKKMPQGLKMIAGDANGNTDTSTQHVNGVIWACYTGSLNYTYIGSTIPDSCPPNTRANAVNGYTKQKDPNAYNPADTFDIQLQALIFFPACVQMNNGQPVLDSPNHKSHVAYFSGNGCPPSHPYIMPQVSYHVLWPGNLDYSQWKLSSDVMANVPDGFSLHADWYGGWVDAVQEQWIKGCINLQLNCSNGVMAAGGGYPQRQLKTIPDYSGPNNLPIPSQ